MYQRTTDICQQTPAFALKRGDGMEFYSNDRSQKVIAKGSLFVSDEGVPSHLYLVTSYLREGDGWIETSEHIPHKSLFEVVAALRSANDFSKAYNEALSIAGQKNTIP